MMLMKQGGVRSYVMKIANRKIYFSLGGFAVIAHLVRAKIPLFLYSHGTVSTNPEVENVFHEELLTLKKNSAYSGGPLGKLLDSVQIYPELDSEDICATAIVACCE